MVVRKSTHFGSVPTIFLSASGLRIVFGLFSSAICPSTPFSECVFIVARRHPNLYANAIAQSKTIACVTNPRDTSTTGEEEEEDASVFVLFMTLTDLLLPPRFRGRYNQASSSSLKSRPQIIESSQTTTTTTNSRCPRFCPFDQRSYVIAKGVVCLLLFFFFFYIKRQK